MKLVIFLACLLFILNVSGESILGRKRGSRFCEDGSSSDKDGDGFLDCHDGCPGDSEKTYAGVCGCGVPDIDSDGDGVPDCVDVCPHDAGKRKSAGRCGCNVVENQCGCNVSPVHVGDCSVVQANVAPGPDADVHYKLFSPDGRVEASVDVPAGALSLVDGERLTLTRQRQDGAAPGGAVVAVALDVLPAAGYEARARPVALARAARTCLRTPRALQAANDADDLPLCVAFVDQQSGELKCFQRDQPAARVDDDDESSALVCGRQTLLTPVHVRRADRGTSIAPYISAVSPASCPGSGACQLRISGGNFDRGALTKVRVGSFSVDPSQCTRASREIVCERAPVGRGAGLPVTVEFTSHSARDAVLKASLDNALSYEAPRIREVRVVDAADQDAADSAARLLVRVAGDNFGPAGPLPSGSVFVGSDECLDARITRTSGALECHAPVVARFDRADATDDLLLPVTLRLGDGTPVVRSSAVHRVRAGCDAEAGEFRCANGACVPASEPCPVCSADESAAPACPLALPLRRTAVGGRTTAGQCQAWSAAALRDAAAPAAFDVALDDTALRVPLGTAGRMFVPDQAAGADQRHCLSVRLVARPAGSPSAVEFVLSASQDWQHAGRLTVAVDAALDPRDYCLGRFDDQTGRWHCASERLDRLAAVGGVTGATSGRAEFGATIALRAGVNRLAVIRDNCPGVANPSQADRDADGLGDACDSPAADLLALAAQRRRKRQSPATIGHHTAAHEAVAAPTSSSGGAAAAAGCNGEAAGNRLYIRKQIKAVHRTDIEFEECPYPAPDADLPMATSDDIWYRYKESSSPRPLQGNVKDGSMRDEDRPEGTCPNYDRLAGKTNDKPFLDGFLFEEVEDIVEQGI